MVWSVTSNNSVSTGQIHFCGFWMDRLDWLGSRGYLCQETGKLTTRALIIQASPYFSETDQLVLGFWILGSIIFFYMNIPKCFLVAFEGMSTDFILI